MCISLIHHPSRPFLACPGVCGADEHQHLEFFTQTISAHPGTGAAVVAPITPCPPHPASCERVENCQRKVAVLPFVRNGPFYRIHGMNPVGQSQVRPGVASNWDQSSPSSWPWGCVASESIYGQVLSQAALGFAKLESHDSWCYS